MMNIKALLIVFVFILLLPNVLAAEEINKTKALDWLFNEMNSSGWDEDIDVIALSILTLGPEDYDVKPGIDKLIELKNGNSWGNPYDSAWAVLALKKAGKNVSSEIQELIDIQEQAQESGNWLIQMRNLNENIATCGVDFNNDDKKYRVQNDTIVFGPSCVGDVWLDFEMCIDDSNDIGIHEEFEVSCINAEPSLLFRNNENEFFILEEDSNKFSIDNACYKSGGECECRNSLYASWVLNEIGESENVWTFPWMSSFCSGEDRNENNALLFLISRNSIYSDQLRDDFIGNSNWDNNEYITSLGILALSRVSTAQEAIRNAEEWLALVQDNSGSWRDDARATAMVLYVLYSKGRVINVDSGEDNGGSYICGNDLREPGEECDGDDSICGVRKSCVSCLCVDDNTSSCTPNDLCQTDSDCTSGTCDLSSCTCDFSCQTDSDCESGEECNAITNRCRIIVDDDECSFDSDCGDGEECLSGLCVEEEKGSGILGIVYTILGIIIVLGIAFLAYIKFVKNKKPKFGKGKSNEGGNRPIVSRKYQPAKQAIRKVPPQRYSNKPSSDTYLERKLDESIKKAKDMLKEK